MASSRDERFLSRQRGPGIPIPKDYEFNLAISSLAQAALQQEAVTNLAPADGISQTGSSPRRALPTPALSSGPQEKSTRPQESSSEPQGISQAKSFGRQPSEQERRSSEAGLQGMNRGPEDQAQTSTPFTEPEDLLAPAAEEGATSLARSIPSTRLESSTSKGSSGLPTGTSKTPETQVIASSPLFLGQTPTAASSRSSIPVSASRIVQNQEFPAPRPAEAQSTEKQRGTKRSSDSAFRSEPSRTHPFENTLEQVRLTRRVKDSIPQADLQFDPEITTDLPQAIEDDDSLEDDDSESPNLQQDQSESSEREDDNARPQTGRKSSNTARPGKKRGPQPGGQRVPKKRSKMSAIDDSHADQEKPGSIPIMVYRMQVPESLEEEAGGHAAPLAYPTKSGVNAVDVLSQICRELIEKTAASLTNAILQERNSQAKAELKRKQAIVEMFGDELDARLFQLTEALDNNHTLTSRLKQATKDRNAARDELLEVKSERDELALQMDQIRAKHERETTAAQKDNQLESMIQDIELAIQRGRAMAMDDVDDVEGTGSGLELRLLNIADQVSSVHGRIGLLDEVKAFNTLLEEALVAI